MNIRGENTRKNIVNNYYIKPLVRMKLLNGVEVKSDAGPIITDEYYIFKSTNKKSKEVEKITCGRLVAHHFLDLIEEDDLELFNPLAMLLDDDGDGNGKGDGGQNDAFGERNQGDNDGEFLNEGDNEGEGWTEGNKQLKNAILWFICIFQDGLKVDTAIYSVLEKVMANKDKEVDFKYVKSTNTIIKGFAKGSTLTELIDDYRSNNNLRDSLCDFSILIGMIDDHNKKLSPGDEDYIVSNF